jgi:hypothetical protein
MGEQVSHIGVAGSATTVASAPARAGRTTGQVVNKVWGSTGGTVLGGAIATLLVWWLDVNHILTAGDLPEAVKAAIGTVVTTVFAFLGGYFTRPGSDEAVTRDSTGSPASGKP